MKVKFTRKSGNIKTGPIPTTMTQQSSCPSSCIFMGNGCYAEIGHVAIHWRKVEDTGLDWDSFCAEIESLPDGQIWRHNVAGDLPNDDGVIEWGMLNHLVESNLGKNGFTYTHHDMDDAFNRASVRQANLSGFTINLSGNDLKHADELYDYDIGPVVVVLPADVEGHQDIFTPKGRRVVVCPAT